MNDTHILSHLPRKRKLRPTNQYIQFLHDEQEPLRTEFQGRVKKTLQTVKISFQGELIKAKCNALIDREDRPGGDRGVIRRFSHAARKNMLETVSRIDWTKTSATFMTLTYHIPVPDAHECKAHLRAFEKRLYRAYGEKVVLWRADIQERRWYTRGEVAWHFHLIIFDLPYVERTNDKGTGMLDWWREITGQPTITELDIQLIHTAKKARSYVARYVGKESGVSVALDHLANLPEALLPGRFWGIENRKNITWAVLVEWVITASNEFSGYFDFKRAARQHWPGVNGSRFEGFTIFVRDIAAWELMFHLLCRAEFSAKRKGVLA